MLHLARAPRLRLTTALGCLVFVTSTVVLGANSDIRLNSIGFLPDRPKQATIISAAAAFEVRRAIDDSIAFNGIANGPIADPETAQQTWLPISQHSQNRDSSI